MRSKHRGSLSEKKELRNKVGKFNSVLRPSK